MNKKIGIIIAGIFGGALACGAIGSLATSSADVDLRQNGASVIDSTALEKTAPVEPEVVTKNETKEVTIPYKTVDRDDNTIAKGTSKVVREGVDGAKEEKYEVTYTDGVETDRKLIATTTVKEPVDKIVANGTYVAPVQSTPTAPTTTCANGTYKNSAGQTVCRPSTQNTGGATAICKDGTYSYSQSRKGTCSRHGGVSRWL